MNTDNLKPGDWISFNYNGAIHVDQILYSQKNPSYPHNWQYCCIHHFVNDSAIKEIRREKWDSEWGIREK